MRKGVKRVKKVKIVKKVVMVVIIVIVGLGGYTEACGQQNSSKLPDTLAIRNALDLIGNLYREDLLCEAGYLYQDKTQIFRKKPTFFSR